MRGGSALFGLVLLAPAVSARAQDGVVVWRSTRGRPSSPWYWAAFQLTGDWR